MKNIKILLFFWQFWVLWALGKGPLRIVNQLFYSHLALPPWMTVSEHINWPFIAIKRKPVVKGQYMVSDTQCPALHDCKFEEGASRAAAPKGTESRRTRGLSFVCLSARPSLVWAWAERGYYRPERAFLRPERADLRLERNDLRPESDDLSRRSYFVNLPRGKKKSLSSFRHSLSLLS